MFPLPKGTRVSQAFGASPSNGVNPSGGHTGNDYACPIGTAVRAPGDGVITYADWASKLPADYRKDGSGPNPYWFAPSFGGIIVSLDCGPVVFHHAHLSSTSKNVGDKVKKGDIIGYSGNTGGATTGPHLHFEAMPNGWNYGNGTYGRVNPNTVCDHYWEDVAGQISAQSSSVKPAALPANQRTSGAAAVNQRAEPKLHAPVVRTIPPRSREVWEGWVHGEDVDLGGGVHNDIWLKDAQGYASILFFDPMSTAGLPDLTPKVQALNPKERVAGDFTVNQRSAPKLDAPSVRQIPAKSKEIFEGFVRGATVDLGGGVKSDLWFKDSIGYASVLFFDPSTTTGLPDLTPAVTTPSPAPTTAPVLPAPAYTFPKAVDLVTEIRPAAEGKFLRGNMPVAVTDLVVHQFIADDTRFDVHLDSVVNAFTGGGDRIASAHFGVEGSRVVQFVDLTDRAYHAGVKGNDFWSIEVYGGMDAETLATVAALIHALETKYGRTLTLHRHKELMATACGTNVDLDRIRALVTALTPATAPAPVPVPAPATSPALSDKAAIMAFLEHIVDEFLGLK
jgi:hypothetical protein